MSRVQFNLKTFLILFGFAVWMAAVRPYWYELRSVVRNCQGTLYVYQENRLTNTYMIAPHTIWGYPDSESSIYRLNRQHLWPLLFLAGFVTWKIAGRRLTSAVSSLPQRFPRVFATFKRLPGPTAIRVGLYSQVLAIAELGLAARVEVHPGPVGSLTNTIVMGLALPAYLSWFLFGAWGLYLLIQACHGARLWPFISLHAVLLAVQLFACLPLVAA